MARKKGSGGIARCLEKDEIRRIEKCLKGDRYETRNLALFYFCISSGARIGEATSLKISQICDDNLRVLDTIQLEKHSTKSKRARNIFLSKQGKIHLQRHVDALRERGKANKDDYVFRGQKCPKKQMRANTGVGIISKVFRNAGIQGASSHSCRKTFANTLRRQGADLEMIRQLLGHRSLQTTSLYFQVDPIEAKQIVAGLRF